MNAREIVESNFRAINEGRLEELANYKSADSTYWISGENSWPWGGWRTPEDMNGIYARIRVRFPDGLKITLRSITAEGNRVVVHLNNHATRVDGRIYDNEIVVLMKIENGLIVEEREFLDTIHANDLFLGEIEK